MLQVLNLAKAFGSEILFTDVNFSINDGEKVGFVGRNGHGKSTLFKILLKQQEADKGEVVYSKNYRIGHLEQHLHFTESTVVNEVAKALPLEEKDLLYKVEKVLMGLGFSTEDFQRSPLELSGGYQVRLNLAKVLVSNAHLLLLDEPTNYLDILSLRWLAKFLREWPHEVFLITHDRDFMDACCNHIVGIHRQRVRKIKGRTEDYFQKITQEEEIYEKTRLNEEKKVKEIEDFIDKFRAKARQGTLVQSRIKALEKKELKQKLSYISQLDFSFTEAPFNGKWPLVIKDLSFAYSDDHALIQNLSCAIADGDRVAIIGKNGKGKTTLLNLIAGELKQTAGNITLHPNAKLAYFAQTNKEHLDANLSIEEEIKNVNPDLSYTRVRQICGTMMFEGDLAKKKIAILSGGEKSRVLLGKILAEPTNLLLLDEPTNHLDMESCLSLIDGLADFKGTVLLVTHNENILRKVPNKFIVFQKNRIEIFDGSYEEFLSKIGWDEEKDISTENANDKNSTLDFHQLKNRRRELIQERSRILSPLKKQFADIEERILALEEEKDQISNQIIELAEKGESASSQTLIRLGEIEKQIDKDYDLFEKIGTEVEDIQQKYELLLKDGSLVD